MTAEVAPVRPTMPARSAESETARLPNRTRSRDTIKNGAIPLRCKEIAVIRRSSDSLLRSPSGVIPADNDAIASIGRATESRRINGWPMLRTNGVYATRIQSRPRRPAPIHNSGRNRVPPRSPPTTAAGIRKLISVRRVSCWTPSMYAATAQITARIAPVTTCRAID